MVAMKDTSVGRGCMSMSMSMSISKNMLASERFERCICRLPLRESSPVVGTVCHSASIAEQ